METNLGILEDDLVAQATWFSDLWHFEVFCTEIFPNSNSLKSRWKSEAQLWQIRAFWPGWASYI